MPLKAKILNIDPAVEEARRNGRKEIEYYNMYCLLLEDEGSLVKTTLTEDKEVRTIAEITWRQSDINKGRVNKPDFFNKYQEIEFDVDFEDIKVSNKENLRKRIEKKDGKIIESHIKKINLSDIKRVSPTTINMHNKKVATPYQILSKYHVNALPSMKPQ